MTAAVGERGAVRGRSRDRFTSRGRHVPEYGGGSGELLDNSAVDGSLTEAQRTDLNVLIVDDEESLLASTASILESDGYRVTALQRGSDGELRLRERADGIVLLDLYMSGVSGSELLKTAVDGRKVPKVIVMTGRPSVESSLEALRAGAWDYLPKPFSAAQLRVLVGRAAHEAIAARDDQPAGDASVRDPADEALLLGDSPVFRGVVSLARMVATTDASVFITGPSGSGKEVIAQFIHRMSRRKTKDIVAINCAALPEPLLESEMFGHVKGAFTGATRDKVGLMEMADGGTLFLDELTEMSPMTQAKLLRVVQDGVVRRVGSSQSDAVVNVRYIAATNRDPEQAIAAGKLREDLYYRLGVVPIEVPALRERPDDIPLLAQHFLTTYWIRHRGAGPPPPRLTPAALSDLRSRPWQGNIRELQNVMEHAIVLAGERDEIDVADLPTGGARAPGDFPLQGSYLGDGVPLSEYHPTRDRVVERFEREYLTCVLQETDGNVSEAARLAGVNRATLYRMLERHGLTKRQIIT
jgi:DNA-binding NtrC family response regulator